MLCFVKILGLNAFLYPFSPYEYFGFVHGYSRLFLKSSDSWPSFPMQEWSVEVCPGALCGWAGLVNSQVTHKLTHKLHKLHSQVTLIKTRSKLIHSVRITPSPLPNVSILEGFASRMFGFSRKESSSLLLGD